MHTKIRSAEKSDWEQISNIYLAGIQSANSTFETALPTWEEWDRAHLQNPRLVVEVLDCEPEKCRIIGWAALSPYSSRAVYSGVAGTSIYLDPGIQGNGVGSSLLGELISKSEEAGIWTLQSGIFPENTASIKLHEKLGFRLVGRRERIAKLNGVWRDVLLFERRSPLF